ncbi:MAG: AAA family ATPase [Actinobacteria bacterium]|nr:AAA family ATPase [Actinomycetota bacterium]
MPQPKGRSAEVERVLALVAAGQSIVVSGEMGIGKTALLDQVATDLRSSGTVVTTIRANAAVANIPFGALTGFLDPNDDADPALQIAAATQRLRRSGGTGPNVLFIDDVQYLDTASIAVVHKLALESDTSIMASLRTTDASNDALAELLRQAEAARLELRPLESAIVTDLVTASLGNHADSDAVSSIVERADGNPLFAAELAKAHLDGTPDGLTLHLLDLVEHRLAALTEAEQQQLTIVAVGQPLDVSLDLVDQAVLSQLETAGFISTVETDGLLTARPGHPLYGEVVRHRLSPLQRRELSGRLASALLSQPNRRRGEALRVVNWLIEAGDRPPPELAEAAAFEAVGWLDTELAERLARMAVEDERTASSLFALGDIRRLSGHPDDAASIWHAAIDIAVTDDDVRKIALALGQLYFLFLNKPDAGIQILETALTRIKDPSLRLGIESDLAMDRSNISRREAAAEIDRLLADPNCGDESAWTALSNILWAKSSSLDLAGIDHYFERAIEIERRLPTDRDSEIDLIRAIRINVEMVRGNLDAAIEVGSDWTTEAGSRGIATGLCLFSTSMIQLMRGHVELADVAATDALAQLGSYDAFNVTPMVHCAASIAAAAGGDEVLAAQRLDTAIERGRGDAPWIQIWAARAAAWVSAARGDVDEACRSAIEGGKYGLDSGDVGWAVIALHDAVAWGGAQQASDLLVRHGHENDCALFDIMFDHAAAAVTNSPGGLANCARRFEASGAFWLAGTAWANRAAAGENEVEICRDATRAICLTPAVGLVEGTVSRALTPRQLDVAELASSGASSKNIAAELFLSGRTVDNHLRDIYRRLGISGRNELPDVVDVLV